MSVTVLRRTALWALPALLASACSSSPPAQGPAPLSVDQATAVATADSVRNSYTDADVAFMTGMISHHAQAVEMSEWAPARHVGAEFQILASRIINSQRDEIALMQRWLRDRGLPVPDPAKDKMLMDGKSQMLMPGMLNKQQMAELKATSGLEFERTFLHYMIMHHQGALGMVDDLFNSYGAGQQQLIFKFASDVYADQSTEIARMQLMLIKRLGQSADN